jgi:hypothetical protein
MEVEVKVNLNPVNALFRRLLGFSPVQSGALAGWQFLRDYHSKMDWKGDRYLGAGPNSGQFARDIVMGWQPPVMAGKNQATVVNTDPLLAWKITGGPIYAQNAQYLTIPVVPEAKGIPAREYPDKLFRAGNALCIKLGNQVRAIYALKQSVYQQPWPGAMPDDADIQAAFVGKVRVELTETING